MNKFKEVFVQFNYNFNKVNMHIIPLECLLFTFVLRKHILPKLQFLLTFPKIEPKIF